MTLPTFSPPQNASFDYAEPAQVPVESITMHKGYEQHRALLTADIRQASLNWTAASEATKDYIVSFFQGLEGSNGPFWWTPYDYTPTPSGWAPTLTDTSGGALGAKTYYVVCTWYDSTYGETKQSAQSTRSVSANRYLQVAVPTVPAWITGWRVYAHETSGSECLQDTVTSGTEWTQSGTLATGTATPPSSNTLQRPAKWNLSGSINKTKITANRWRISLTLVEQII